MALDVKLKSSYGYQNISYMYGGTDGERKPLYGTALMAPGPAAFKHKPSTGDHSITVLVDSVVSDHYFDDLIILSLKNRLLNYVLLTTPRRILPAGGALLNGTAEEILEGLVTDNHGQQHLARIAILIVPGIGCNLFSVESATKKGVVSIFDFDDPRLELSGITVLLRAEGDSLYSLVFDLNTESHGSKKLAMNAMTNVQLWHRRLGHLNKRSLELRGVTATGSPLTVQSIIATSTPWEKATSWLTPRSTNTQTLRPPFYWFMEI